MNKGASNVVDISVFEVTAVAEAVGRSENKPTHEMSKIPYRMAYGVKLTVRSLRFYAAVL